MSIIDQPEKKPRGLRAVYAWMLANASGPRAWAAVAAFAFAEASFFPIPADVMVLPMMLADRKRRAMSGDIVPDLSVPFCLRSFHISESRSSVRSGESPEIASNGPSPIGEPNKPAVLAPTSG